MKGQSHILFKIISRYLILFLASLTILAISYFHLTDTYELNALDIRFLLRPKIPTTDKLLIIEIGEDSIKKLGRFPFNRSYHAVLIKALKEFGAKAVLFDILFSEPSEHDRAMEEAIKDGASVYLPFAFNIDLKKKTNVVTARDYAAECLETLAHHSKGLGHINIIPDGDGKFRRVPLFVEYGDTCYPYLSFLLASDYLGISMKDVSLRPGKALSLGKKIKIPLDESSNMLVNFSGKWGESYKHYSYVDVLQSYFAYLSGQKPILDTRYFKEKICIVGLTALGTGDLHPSPFEPLYPGVGIHAEVFNSILNSQFIARASRGTNLAILVILGFLASLSTLKTKPIRGLFALLGSISAFAAISIYLFTLFGVWIDMVWPIFIMASLYVSVTLYKYLVEWKRRLVFENELGIARKIQESFLPKKTPLVKGIDLTAAVFSARQVGGDLYDYLEFGPEKIGVMIGDVSGKGIPASLFMAMVTGSFKFFATEGAKPKDALSNLNAKLLRESASNLFVTIFYAVFDTKLGILTYSNSGHLPLIYSSQGKKVEFLDVGTGAPLGLVEGEYSDGKVNFKEGDIFVFYTDGVTEAMNIKSDMYGKDRLASIIENNRELDSKAILKAIEKDVRRFESKAGQHDDMTIIVTKISS